MSTQEKAIKGKFKFGYFLGGLLCIAGPIAVVILIITLASSDDLGSIWPIFIFIVIWILAGIALFNSALSALKAQIVVGDNFIKIKKETVSFDNIFSVKQVITEIKTKALAGVAGPNAFKSTVKKLMITDKDGNSHLITDFDIKKDDYNSIYKTLEALKEIETVHEQA